MPSISAATRRKILVSVLALAAAISVAAAVARIPANRPLPVPPSGDIIAVGKTVVPDQLVNGLMSFTKHSYKQNRQPWPKPGTEQYSAVRDNVVDQLALLAEADVYARSLGIKLNKAQAQAAYQQVRNNYPGAKYKEWLNSNGLTDALLRGNLADITLENQLRARLINELPKPTMAQMKAWYAKYKGTLAQPASRRVRAVSAPTKVKVERLVSTISTQAIGTVSAPVAGQNVPPQETAFVKAIFALQNGQLSAPLQTPGGWVIATPAGPLVPARTPTLAEAKATVEAQLLSQQQQKVLTNFLVTLRKRFQGQVSFAPGWQPAVETAKVAGVPVPVAVPQPYSLRFARYAVIFGMITIFLLAFWLQAGSGPSADGPDGDEHVTTPAAEA